MKRLATILALAAGLATGPALAADEGGHILNKENVGGALGATLGAVVGSQFGDGKGQLATTAVGAVGGYVVGRNVAHNYQGGSYEDGNYQRGHYQGNRQHPSKRSHYRKDQRRYESRGRHKPRIRPIHELYVAKSESNVRSGPGTRFRVIDQLHDHERVRVVGKVSGRNWYMVRARRGKGFVYAPLLRPAHGGYGHSKRYDKYDASRIRPIRELYVAKTESNIRSGPGTRFRIIDQLRDHERVRVVGKVKGRNWYMVRARRGEGFVYAPLLRPAHGGYSHSKRRDKHDRHGYRDNRWRP